MAVVIALLGLGTLTVLTLALAVVQLGKVLACLWSDSVERSLLAALIVATVWLVVRWKKSCL